MSWVGDGGGKQYLGNISVIGVGLLRSKGRFGCGCRYVGVWDVTL